MECTEISHVIPALPLSSPQCILSPISIPPHQSSILIIITSISAKVHGLHVTEVTKCIAHS